MELTQTILTPTKMKNYVIGYAKSLNENYTWTSFNSFKEAKNYIAKMYSNKKLFTVDTDNKTTFLITPNF